MRAAGPINKSNNYRQRVGNTRQHGIAVPLAQAAARSTTHPRNMFDTGVPARTPTNHAPTTDSTSHLTLQSACVRRPVWNTHTYKYMSRAALGNTHNNARSDNNRKASDTSVGMHRLSHHAAAYHGHGHAIIKPTKNKRDNANATTTKHNNKLNII